MANTSKISKKAARKQVEKKLEVTLATLEPILGNKDFKRRLKNAGKVFMKGLKNRKSQLALANLKQIDFSQNGHRLAKKNTIKNLTPQIVNQPKRKTASAHPTKA